MNEFFIWFWRPIAELLGGLAMVLAIGALLLVGYWACVALSAIESGWRRLRDALRSARRYLGRE